MMCILLPISCWPFEKVLYFAQRLVSTAVTIISTFLCIISINVVTKLFYLQTHQLENFLYGEDFPTQGCSVQGENGVNYTKRAILQVMKEALYAESSRFTF